MIRVLGALLVTLLCCAIARGEEDAGASDGEEERPQEIAEADRALIEKVAGILPPRGKVRGLTAALGRESADEVRDLGFDLAWRRYELYADALTLWVDVVSRRDWIAGLRIRALDADPDYVRSMRRAWGKDLRRVDGGAELRRVVAAEMARLTRSPTRVLGDAPPGGPSGSTTKAVALLSDPLADLTFGTACYEDGSAPLGRDAVDALYRGGSSEALGHVLVGPNPEGRVYAAEALLMFEREGMSLRTEHRQAVEKVVALGVPIRACDGCLVYDASATELLGAPHARSDFLAARYLCRIVERIEDLQGSTDVGVLDVLWDGRFTYRRLPRGGALACIPMVVRATLPEKVYETLRARVGKGPPFRARDGVPETLVRVDDPAHDAPEAVAAALRHARARLDDEP